MIKAEKPPPKNKNKTKRKSKKITYIVEGDQGRKTKNNTKRKSKQNHLHTKGEIKAEKPKIKPEKNQNKITYICFGGILDIIGHHRTSLDIIRHHRTS